MVGRSRADPSLSARTKAIVILSQRMAVNARSGCPYMAWTLWVRSADDTGAPVAAPGILCLARSGTALNVNCFAVIPGGEAGPLFVQAFRLIKQVPGSFKCPDVYGTPHFDDKGNLLPYQYFQFGTGVRTWWS